MADCKRIRSKIRKICIGDMDKQIILKSRSISSPLGDSVDYSEEFTEISNPWSMVHTLSRGPIFFDDTNIATQVTHIFGIRYESGITSEIWVEYDGENYDVLNVENLDQRSEFLILSAVHRGDANILVNQV